MEISYRKTWRQRKPLITQPLVQQRQEREEVFWRIYDLNSPEPMEECQDRTVIADIRRRKSLEDLRNIFSFIFSN